MYIGKFLRDVLQLQIINTYMNYENGGDYSIGIHSLLSATLDKLFTSQYSMQACRKWVLGM